MAAVALSFFYLLFWVTFPWWPFCSSRTSQLLPQNVPLRAGRYTHTDGICKESHMSWNVGRCLQHSSSEMQLKLKYNIEIDKDGKRWGKRDWVSSCNSCNHSQMFFCIIMQEIHHAFPIKYSCNLLHRRAVVFINSRCWYVLVHLLPAINVSCLANSVLGRKHSNIILTYRILQTLIMSKWF